MNQIDLKMTIIEKTQEDIEALKKATEIIEGIVDNHIPSIDMYEAINFLEDIKIETQEELQQLLFLQSLKAFS